MQLTAGEVVADKYQVESLLGDGGMGSVYVATNQVLRRRIALKVMNERFAGTKEASARFIKEAVALSRVTHPNIVQVFDAGEHRGQPWIAMELLEGESLAARLERGPLTVSETLRLAEGMLGALAEVHSEGIVHRDLKPDNIFMARTKSGLVLPKLLDFGVAKNLNESEKSRLTTAGSVIGTMHYLAPEQAHGEANIDHRADLYAVGVVLFEALSGQTPYAADTLLELVLKMVTEPPRKLSELARGVPPDLVAIIERCLASSPDQRFQSAAQLVEALQRVSEPASRASLAGFGEAPTGYGPILSGTPNPALSAMAGRAPSVVEGPTSPRTTGPLTTEAPAVNEVAGPNPLRHHSNAVVSHEFGQPDAMTANPALPAAMSAPPHEPRAVLPNSGRLQPAVQGGFTQVVTPQHDLRPLAVLLGAFLFGALIVASGAWYLLGTRAEVAQVSVAEESGLPLGVAAPPAGIDAPLPSGSANVARNAGEPRLANEDDTPSSEAPSPSANLSSDLDGDPPNETDSHARTPSGLETPPAGIEPPSAAASDRRRTPAASAHLPPATPTARIAPRGPSAPANVLERQVVRVAPRTTNGLTDAAIEQALSRQIPRMRECTDRLAARRVHGSGAITIRWTIDRSGRPVGFTVERNETGDQWLARCATQVLSRFSFPPAANGRASNTSRAFRFVF